MACTRVNLLSEHYSRIFLLSHMRAFTSLAGHILGSHPQINGYFEMHISYEDASALDKQLDLFLESEELKLNSRYLFDKLLHNDYSLKLERFGLPDSRNQGTKIPDIKLLVALREPEQTIKSIVDLLTQKETEELYASPVEASRYYVERVQALADFCRTVNQPYYYYDAAMLPGAPDTLLPKLSRWLELESPLNERYEIFSRTGEVGKGDSSENLRSGRINQTENVYSNIRIPDEQLKAAQQVYRDCRQRIIDNAMDWATLDKI